VGAGTFVSRVFDGGAPTGWQSLSWQAQTPTGTALAMSVRTGNSTIPDGSWTAWKPVASSGGQVDLSGRYAQYRAELSSSDPDRTPLLEQVTLATGQVPVNQPPSASDDAYVTAENTPLNVAAPGVLANDSDPDGNTLSAFKLSDPQHGTLTLNANGSFGYTPTAGYSGPDSFSYRASDGSASSATATVALTVTAAAPSGLTDTTVADFTAGTLGTGLYLGQGGDGELLLAPTVGTEFSGSALPVGWASAPWSTGSNVTVSGGALRVDGSLVATDAFFGSGRALEFVGSFGSDPFQHIGFGQSYNDSTPWAHFSSGGGSLALGLWAKTNNGQGVAQSTQISGVSPSVPHRYRVEWRAAEALYFVDGQEVARHPITIGAQMRPAISDFNVDSTRLTVDWLRMSPYAGSGTFSSRIFDAGSRIGWETLSWQAQGPTGTTLALSVRTGETATPDNSWSGWKPVASSGGQIGLAGRYAQYRAELASSNPDVTPLLEQVSFTTGTAPPLNRPPTAVGDSYETGQGTPLSVAAPGVLGNDSDPDGDPLSAVKVSDPQHGSLSLNANGSFSYTPAAGYVGPDTFSYKASDGSADSGTATVTITVKDATPPSVTINQASGQGDPTNTLPIRFTVAFNEPVSGFNGDDVTVTGTAPGTPTASVTGSGRDYVVSISGLTGGGTVIASIAAGKASDAAGNANTASTSTDNSVSYDPTAPSVTVNQASGQADPTGSLPIRFSVVFSEPVTGFTNDDVTVGGTAPGTPSVVVSGSGTTYEVAVSGLTGGGTVIASVAAGKANDAAGNANTASTSTDNTVSYDPDTDGDGVVDSRDNCRTTPNPGQQNNDGDAQGDACDADDDNDTVADGTDNCPLTANADQKDTDRDGKGDACDSVFNSTPCRIVGTGSISTVKSFNLGVDWFAGSTSGTGSASYTDATKGATKSFRSTKITGVVCRTVSGGREATIVGTGTVNSTQTVSFEINVADRGSGATDTFSITWSAPAYAASGTLIKGDNIITPR
jgi:VCBS repeat-containing protein